MNLSAETISLENMQVGDIVTIGDTCIEKISDEELIPKNVSRKTIEGFDVDNFGGNRSLNKELALTSTYKYFYIYLYNSSSTNKITVTIGNDEATESENYYTLGKGTHYIYSTSAWPKGDHNVGFTCGSGMYGKASARLCSTLKEAENHNS